MGKITLMSDFEVLYEYNIIDKKFSFSLLGRTNKWLIDSINYKEHYQKLNLQVGMNIMRYAEFYLIYPLQPY